MSIDNPVNLAPVLATQTAQLTAGLDANKADIAAALAALVVENNENQADIASALVDLINQHGVSQADVAASLVSCLAKDDETQAAIALIKSSVLQVVDLDSGVVPAGVSGDILVLTAPDGQLVRLHHLCGMSRESGIALSADGVQITSGLLDDVAPNTTNAGGADFVVSRNFGSTNFFASARVIEEVVGSVVTISKIAGNTANPINWAVEYVKRLA